MCEVLDSIQTQNKKKTKEKEEVNLFVCLFYR
jgi:hypothetical protein